MGKGAKAEQVVREIHRQTRRRFSVEEKVRIVLGGGTGQVQLARRGDECRRYYLMPQKRRDKRLCGQQGSPAPHNEQPRAADG